MSDWFLKSLADSSHCACSPKPCPQIKTGSWKKHPASLTQPQDSLSLGAKPLSSTQRPHLSSQVQVWVTQRCLPISDCAKDGEISPKSRPHPAADRKQRSSFSLLLMSLPISLSPYGKRQILTGRMSKCKKGPWRIIQGQERWQRIWAVGHISGLPMPAKQSFSSPQVTWRWLWSQYIFVSHVTVNCLLALLITASSVISKVPSPVRSVNSSAGYTGINSWLGISD